MYDEATSQGADSQCATRHRTFTRGRLYENPHCQKRQPRRRQQGFTYPATIRVPATVSWQTSLKGISMSTALAPRMRNRKWSALVVGLLASIGLCASTVTASATSDGHLYTVQNYHSGYCMSVPGDDIHAGALINQYPCGNYEDQFWIKEDSDSQPGWFYFQPYQDKTLCVTYARFSTAELTLQPCGLHAVNGNTSTQLWYWSSGLQLETTVGDVWVMSVPGAATGVAPINIYPYGSYDDQDWSLDVYV